MACTSATACTACGGTKPEIAVGGASCVVAANCGSGNYADTTAH